MDYKTIQEDIRTAAIQFGLYTMGDKGAGEVMELNPYVVRFDKMKPEDAAQMIIDVMEKTDDEIVKEGAYAWASSVVGEMEFKSEDWFSTFLDHDNEKLSEFY